MRITSSTSINGIRLISSSSLCVPRRKSTPAPSADALAVNDLDQFHCLALHFHDQGVDLVPVVAVEDHAWNGNDQSHRRVVERDRNSVCKHDRIAAARRLRAENLY